MCLLLSIPCKLGDEAGASGDATYALRRTGADDEVVAGSNLQDIIKLGSFVVASYLGLAIMFVVHGILLGVNGISPLKYFRKVWPVLTFAFTSRSSAASIPLNVEAQTRRLGVPESIASFAASFGATIGQNGCAGLILRCWR